MLKKFYQYTHHHINSNKPNHETIILRTRFGSSMTFTGSLCGPLSAAIQRSSGMIYSHPNNTWRREPMLMKAKNTKSKNATAQKSDNEDNHDETKEPTEDLGVVSDSYQGSTLTDNEGLTDDDEEETRSNTGLPVQRHIVDCMGALSSTTGLKNIGEIQFCGLLLQDKGQGWKQKRVVVLTTNKLLTFKLNSNRNTVKLSKNILVASIINAKMKRGNARDQTGKRVDGLIIELNKGKKKKFDFEGEGCNLFYNSLQYLIGKGGKNEKRE